MKKLCSGEQLSEAARKRLLEIEKELSLVTRNKVQSGPFAGMILPVENVDYNHITNCSKLLGCYEQELHTSVEQAIKRNPDVVINVGAAEGFYAVGLARRLPHATVYAFEKVSTIAAVCHHAATLNNVTHNLILQGSCDRDTLLRVASQGEKILLIMDCEGDERFLLTRDILQQLTHADIIVECHDFIDCTITPLLSQRLQANHRVERFSENGRNPSSYQLLRFFTSLERYLVVSEFHPEIMSWLVAWSESDTSGG